MPNTLIPIQTYTLAAATASVTFSNIPQNYTDLKLIVSTRSVASNNVDAIYARFNSSSTGYTNKVLYGESTGQGSLSPAINYSHVGYGVGGAGTSSTFSNVEMTIPNYTSANTKILLADSVTETNASTYQSGVQSAEVSIWANSAAINSITFTQESAGNFAIGSTFTLYGVSNGVKATGGTITVAAGYAYHTFTSTGSFLPSQKITGAEVLTIAGGGSGGEGNSGYWQVGGGGGAGGVVYNNALNLTAGTTYTATVGAGGTRVSSRHGVQGNNSQFGPLTSAIGGGYGGAMSGVGGSLGPGGNGGNGGGNEGYGVWSRSTGSQGFGGGLGVNDQDRGGAGGGGGAGGQGGDGSGTTGGNGGAGTNVYSNFAYATLTGVNGFYAGGGAGSGSASGGPNGSGGSGGGGAPGVAGTANTGSGSGGTRSGNAVANGGSGIIIVRYPVL
jgi:hypothetical protein